MKPSRHMPNNIKLSIKEKIGYALGDGAANIAWRAVATFLFIFYTDVFGLSPTTVGILVLTARFSDGISDIVMGIIGDHTTSKYGKFRPWILWTAIPLGVILSLLFTSPELSANGKIVYAYVTYILFTLIYTANNIPYGALMGVMTANDKERTSIGSFRMIGAFGGGMIVQGALLFLVAYFGNVEPKIKVAELTETSFKVDVIASKTIEHVNIKTGHGIANFSWNDTAHTNSTPANTLSFSMKKGEHYSFIVSGEKNISPDSITIVDQKTGYRNAIYIMSILLTILMLITFSTTKERVLPPKDQKTNLKQDIKDLFSNKPWLILLIIGLLFNIYNCIKQGVVVYYFTHYLNNQLLSASYLIALMLASIAGAFMTAYLSKRFGKRNVFIFALLFSGFTNALLCFCGPNDINSIFIIGMLSECASAIFPTLFFVMLGDAADFSEWKNGRRATGLVYSAGSFASKFGGGIAGFIVMYVLTLFGYDGLKPETIKHATKGMIMLMSWIPALITLVAAGLMLTYPLTQKKLDKITLELQNRRTSKPSNS